MKTSVAVLTCLALLVSLAPPAPADVGIVSASRHAAEPGDRVSLTVGCGFCFPPCVGYPGHRHPQGERNGACMLGTHRKPAPASFQLWLTPLGHSLAPYVCDPGDPCEPGSSRPPHLPSFIYLGRAVPLASGGEAHEIPRYRLTFEVPEARPGGYKYVLFCDACADGPRGSLVENVTQAAGRLRVLPALATAGGGGDRALPWIGAGALGLLLGLGAGAFLLRGQATGPKAGPAA